MTRIALAQINPTVGDLKGNKLKIESYIQRAKKNQVDIIVFPEMAISGYPPEDLMHKDHFIKDNLKTLKQLSLKVSGITVIVGCIDQKKKKIFNACAVLENKKIKHIYHKQCLPNYGVFDEKRYFSEGNSSKVVTCNSVKYALSICEDIWEGVTKKQARLGAKLLINVSASPYDVGKFDERVAIMKKRAREAKAHVCYCNLVGGQDELVFDGGSLIIDPNGRVVSLAKEFEEELLITDIVLGKNRKKKKAIKNLISEPTSLVSRVYKALVLGTKDYAKKNGFKKVILGISGGIDSALVASIAVDALGKENVIGVSMPSEYSSEGTQTDARRLAENLGIEFKEIPIERVFDAYLHVLDGEFAQTKKNIAEENLQARIRGNFLMALSNKFGYLVLTTGNKSEVAVGYCTLYGDMSGGFAVIKDVPKTLVYQLCDHINKASEIVIPETVLTRAPSAELREDQKDSDSLPEYNYLDRVLKDYVEDHKSLADIEKGKKKELVKRVIALVDRNEYKRRQSPPGIKITPRAFGRDRRLPITNKYKEF